MAALKKKLEGMDPLQYERSRTELATEWGIRLGELDKIHAQCHKAQLDDLQGEELRIDDPEPWPDPVDGADLLDEIERQVQRFVVLPKEAIVPLLLWVCLTYAAGSAEVLPMLVFSSPVKRSGKTTALEIVRRLVRGPLPVSSISPAALFRTIQKCAPTIIIDEADSMFRENEELRTLLNASYTRTSAFVVRCVGDDQVPRRFSTWCPKALALIGELPPTLADRSIIIHMKRKATGVELERLRADSDLGFSGIRRRIARFMMDSGEARLRSDPLIPHELNDRAADSWRELLRIADAAGGAWPERARASAMATAGSLADEDDLKVLLLSDLKAYFMDRGKDRYASAELIEYLIGLEGHPWPDFRKGAPMTTNSLARLLRGFGVQPHAAKVGGKTCQCYESANFEEAFKLYASPKDQAKHNSTEEGQKTLTGNELVGCYPDRVADADHNQTAAGCEMQPQPAQSHNSANSCQESA